MNSIFLTTPGKVGTRWLSSILSSLLDLKQESSMTVIKTDEYDCSVYIAQVVEFEKQCDNNMHVKHLPLGVLSCLNEGIKIVVMVRDFRDMLVSYAYYSSRGSEQLKEKRKVFDVSSIEPDFKKKLDVLFRDGPNQRFFNSYFENKDIVPHSLVRYEDMVQNGFETIKTLLQSLDKQVEDQKIREALNKYSFENLRRGGRGHEHHYRKGIIGDWKNHMTEEENREFREKYGHWMSYFGYE